jgi:uncharacterized repeat protein (TIGR01451 family)
VAAGSVAVTEVALAGFTLQNVVGGTLAGTTATALIAPGQGRTLTFINAPTTTPGAGLSINTIASSPTANVGNPLTYTITITNTSGAVATGVTVMDTLPANVVFGSATATVGSCSGSSASTTVTCSIGTLTAGATATVTIGVAPTPPAAGTTLTNTATATGAGLPTVTASVVTPVTGGPFPPGTPPFPGGYLPSVPPPPLEFLPPPGPPPFPLPPAGGFPGAPRRFAPEVPMIPEADTIVLVVGGLVVLGGLVALRSHRRRD